MEESRAGSAQTHRQAKWGFALMIGVLILVAVGKAVLADTLDPDMFWHLRVAEQLQAPGMPGPVVDHLAFASVKEPWTPYSWLAELGMKCLWDWAGYRGVVAVQATLEGGFVFFVALAGVEISVLSSDGPERRPRYLPVVFATVIAVFFSLAYLSFRPVTIALFFLAAAAWIIQRDRRLLNRSRAIWLLVPLTVLLTNIHLYAVFLPAAIFGVAVGMWWELRGALANEPTRGSDRSRRGSNEPPPRSTKSAPESRETILESRRRLNRHLPLLLGTTLGCLATPMLPGVISSAIHYQFGDAMVASPIIAEMRPFYSGGLGLISVAMVLFILGCAIRHRKNLQACDWTWLIGAILVLLRMGRFGPIFAIFAVPTLAATCPRLSDGVLARPAVRFAMATLLILGFVRVGRGFPTSQTSLSNWLNRNGPDCPGYPTSAADFVAANIPARSHRLVNEFTWGGYLEWRLSPGYQVLMDGRTQVFPGDFWKAVYLGAPVDRKKYLATLDADAAVLPIRGSAFHQDLIDLGWKQVYADDRAEVLQPPTGDRANSGKAVASDATPGE